MHKMADNLRVILISGPSHAGKSTLAHSLSLKLGWSRKSTDKLARHPGRPWTINQKPVPEHVAEHYLSLSVDELIEDVLRHYKMNVWPSIESIVTLHSSDTSTDRLILEGSALWPDLVATLNTNGVAAIWLTASNNLLQTRIHNASRFDDATTREKTSIQIFLERSNRYNERMIDSINRLKLISINVEATPSLDELTDKCLELINYPRAGTSTSGV